MKSLAVLSVALGLAFTATNEADAQYYYRHRGHYHTYSNNSYYRPTHYHDSAGHMVDSYGHHVDSYGRHTGATGLYEGNIVGNALPYAANYGAPSPPMQPGYGGPIRISSPAASTAIINYSLNGFRYEIRPGEVQTLVNDRLWTIQFDRGGEFGRARYSLGSGDYEFTASATGWDFVQVSAPNAPNAPTLSDGLPRNPLPAAAATTPSTPPAPTRLEPVAVPTK